MSELTKIGNVVPVSDELLEDTILAFHAFAGPTIGVAIKDDPFGPLNKIVRFTRNNEPIGPAALYPVHAMSSVVVGRGYRTGYEPSPWSFINIYSSVWYIEIDGKRILEAHPYDLEPPLPPRPPIPLRRRVRIAYDRRRRAALDAIAHRLGYVHEDSIESDW